MLSKRARPYNEEDVPPQLRLARNVQDLVGSNALPGQRLQSLVNDAVAAGSEGFSSDQVAPDLSPILVRPHGSLEEAGSQSLCRMA